MMEKTLENIGFEVMLSDEKSVTLKRVLNKSIPQKEKYKREMSLPKLTIECFDKKDLEELQKIQIDVSKYEFFFQENTFETKIKNAVCFIAKFLMK